MVLRLESLPQPLLVEVGDLIVLARVILPQPLLLDVEDCFGLIFESRDQPLVTYDIFIQWENK